MLLEQPLQVHEQERGAADVEEVGLGVDGVLVHDVAGDDLLPQLPDLGLVGRESGPLARLADFTITRPMPSRDGQRLESTAVQLVRGAHGQGGNGHEQRRLHVSGERQAIADLGEKVLLVAAPVSRCVVVVCGEDDVGDEILRAGGRFGAVLADRHGGVGDAAQAGLQDGRFDVGEVHADAAQLDLRVTGDAALENETAVGAKTPAVAGPVLRLPPAGCELRGRRLVRHEGLGRELIVVEVAQPDAGAADADFARDAGGDGPEVAVDDGDGVVGPGRQGQGGDVSAATVALGVVIRHLTGVGREAGLGRPVSVEEAEVGLAEGPERGEEALGHLLAPGRGHPPLGALEVLGAGADPRGILGGRGLCEGDILGGHEPGEAGRVAAKLGRGDDEGAAIGECRQGLGQGHVEAEGGLLQHDVGALLEAELASGELDVVPQGRVAEGDALGRAGRPAGVQNGGRGAGSGLGRHLRVGRRVLRHVDGYGCGFQLGKERSGAGVDEDVRRPALAYDGREAVGRVEARVQGRVSGADLPDGQDGADEVQGRGLHDAHDVAAADSCLFEASRNGVDPCRHLSVSEAAPLAVSQGGLGRVLVCHVVDAVHQRLGPGEVVQRTTSQLQGLVHGGRVVQGRAPEARGRVPREGGDKTEVAVEEQVGIIKVVQILLGRQGDERVAFGVVDDVEADVVRDLAAGHELARAGAAAEGARLGHAAAVVEEGLEEGRVRRRARDVELGEEDVEGDPRVGKGLL
ncbi:hypothetical protein ColKHC_14171 [Colletotrichum higginsianum]|nr:hypothetical protein ColKHC_14171 [Colletotrichum higginsianum]